MTRVAYGVFIKIASMVYLSSCNLNEKTEGRTALNKAIKLSKVSRHVGGPH